MEDYAILDLSHLTSSAQLLAQLPSGERIMHIRADRWIGYPRAVVAVNSTLSD